MTSVVSIVIVGSRRVAGKGLVDPDRIAGLQALLEGAPSLPDSKLLWHCTLKELLDGT